MLTKEMLKQIAPNAKETVIGPLVGYLNHHMPKYEVNTYLRVCHLLAQAAHESASYRTLEEYASGKEYEGRADLGNVVKGDGERYKGRGIFQLTGRSNYRKIGKLIGMDLENNPDLAESPEVSVLTALEYWKGRGLNAFADKDDILTITHRINGGENGLSSRKVFLAAAKKAIPKNISFEPPPVPVIEEPPPPPVDPLIPAIVVAKLGDNSPYIADLQTMLNKKGFSLVPDGIFGPKTEQATKEYQTKNGLAVTGAIDTNTLNKLMV